MTKAKAKWSDKPRPTRGSALLAKKAPPARQLAEVMGVSKTLAAYWLAGQRRPTKAQQAKLEELYGIPPGEAWNEPAGRRSQKPAAPQGEPSPIDPVTGDEDTSTSNIGRLHRFIRDGLQALESDRELSATKKAEALKKLADAQVALDKSTGENALTMARIVAHPAFKHAVQTITDAITPYPEARAALTKALHSLRASS